MQKLFLWYNEIMEELREKSVELKKEFQKKVVGYILAAFGLVAGLAWNEAIKSLIDYLFPLSKNSLLAKFVYAILITLVVVLVATYVSKFFMEEGKKK